MLTAKEREFVKAYLTNFNAKEAAIAAGYAPKSAKVTGCRLLQKPAVSKAVEIRRQKQIETIDLSAVRVLEELRRLAFSDIRQLFDESGNLRPLQDLTPEQSASIASIEIVKKNLAAGDGKTDTVHKLKVWDKTKSLELLAKHFALLTEKIELAEGDALTARLLAGRKRAADLAESPAK